jgi:hypothetical protein
MKLPRARSRSAPSSSSAMVRPYLQVTLDARIRHRVKRMRGADHTHRAAGRDHLAKPDRALDQDKVHATVAAGGTMARPHSLRPSVQDPT